MAVMLCYSMLESLYEKRDVAVPCMDIIPYAINYHELISPLTFHLRPQFIDCCLRGTSQVFLINNPVTGAFILVAIAVDSWYTLIYAVVGLLSSTGTGMMLGLDRASISAGLYGYNGILTGIAVSLFSFGTSANPSFQYVLYIIYVI